MSRPLKKPLRPSRKSKIDKKKLGAALTKVGGALKPLITSHPTIFGLSLMTGCQLAKMGVLMTAKKEDLSFTSATPLGRGSHYTPKTGSRQDVVFTELQGLYDAAAGLTTAAVAVPLVSAGAQLAGSILSARSQD